MLYDALAKSHLLNNETLTNTSPEYNDIYHYYIQKSFNGKSSIEQGGAGETEPF